MDNRFRSRRTRNLRRRLAVGCAAVILTCLGVLTTVPGSSRAFAGTVVDGCTIVANPTATHFTDCPGVDFSSADLSGVDLSYANLTGARFANCIEQTQFPPLICSATDLDNVDLHDATVSNAAFDAKVQGSPSMYVFATTSLHGATLTGLQAVGVDMEQVLLAGLDLSGSDFTNADLSPASPGFPVGSGLHNANFTDANFSRANLESADLTGANWTGADLSSATLTDAVLSNTDFSGANLQSAELTGTALVPPDQSAEVPSSAGGPVTWSTPAALPGATPGTCTPASGSTFLPGQFGVTCTVTDDANHQATGGFRLDVSIPPVIQITTTWLPPATIGVPYSVALSVTGGNPPYTWKRLWLSGSYPRGLRLDHATGVISGIPTKLSTSRTFTIEVLDTKTPRSKGHPATRNTAIGTFSIAISP